MTDRINALVLALDHDIRDDDMERIISAVKSIRGVCDAKMNVVDIPDMVAESRARRDMRSKLFALLDEME